MFIRDDLFNEVAGIFVILAGFVSAWILMDYHEFTIEPLSVDPTMTHYEIRPGQTLISIATEFEQKGWIKHKEYLTFYAKYHHLTAIKAGEYAINKEMNMIELLNHFVAGKVILHSITFIEGWSFKQMMAAMSQKPFIKKTLPSPPEEKVMALLGAPKLHYEGQFLPDTYFFTKNTTDLQILKMAHRAMNKALDEAWKQIPQHSPLKSRYEALILASIVEKETGNVDERPLIAAVFLSRLNKRMKLQTDPTVIYGMGEHYQGNIRRKDLKQDTPYNTYVHRGLTPTPICMPSRAAINSVVKPNDQGYLYFVAKGNGSHYFSKSLKEHNAAVRKYQLKR